MTFVPVCLESEVSTERLKVVVLDGVKILLSRSDDNKIWAFESVCTHADKSLELGKWDPKKAYLTCPFHHAVFSISQHGIAIAPPAVLPLKTYSTKIEMHNSEPTVWVDLDS